MAQIGNCNQLNPHYINWKEYGLTVELYNFRHAVFIPSPDSDVTNGYIQLDNKYICHRQVSLLLKKNICLIIFLQ